VSIDDDDDDDDDDDLHIMILSDLALAVID